MFEILVQYNKQHEKWVVWVPFYRDICKCFILKEDARTFADSLSANAAIEVRETGLEHGLQDCPYILHLLYGKAVLEVYNRTL